MQRLPEMLLSLLLRAAGTAVLYIRSRVVAFRLPTFNLSVNIWRDGNAVGNPPDVQTAGNLVASRPDADPIPSNPGSTTAAKIIALGLFGRFMTLLLPKLADVRPPGLGPGNWGDVIEVPAGSGRYYMTMWVDDVGKGFPNEHRYAYLIAMTNLTWRTLFQNAGATTDWPVPIP